MASIGSSLPNAEATWKRYNNDNSNFSYDSSWVFGVRNNGSYVGNAHYSSTIGSKFKFNFTNTKIRIFCETWSSFSNSASILIDGIEIATFTTAVGYGTRNGYNILVYEKTGLQNIEHFVTIIQNSNKTMFFEEIDIDENGILLPYNEKPPKFFIKDGNNLCKSDDGQSLIIPAFMPFSVDKFDSYAMDNLHNINPFVLEGLANENFNVAILKKEVL